MSMTSGATSEMMATDPIPTSPVRLGTVVVGVDGSPSSARALDWAAALVHPEGKVVVVHAVPVGESMVLDATPFGEPTWRRALRRRIADEWCAALRERDVAFEVRLIWRGVAAAILSVAEEEGADLVVVGANRHHDHVIHHQGTLATYLDHRSTAPVLCVPSEPVVPG